MNYLMSFLGALFWTTFSFSATLGSVETQNQALDRQKDIIFQAFKEGLGKPLNPSDKIQMVAGGFSKADLFKVTVSDKSYIVKIMKDSPQVDVETEIRAAQITGEIGVGPKLYYSNPKSKTLILAYIENHHTINRHGAPFHKMVAHEIRRFHEAKPLNRHVRFFDILRQDAERLVEKELVSSFANDEEAAFYAKMAKEVEEIFKHFSEDIRPVHHDISPHNVLYDTHKAWLIDWETASNDYYPIDLCMFANFHIYDETLLPDFMQAYYGRQPTQIERAKFHVIRPFCYGFHGLRLAFLSDQKTRPTLGNVLAYKQFQLAIRQGHIALGSPESLFALAVSTTNKALAMLKSPEFQAGLMVLKKHLKEKGVSI